MTTDATGTIPEGTTERWKDRKRYLWLMGLLVPGFAIIAFVTYALYDWSWVLWIGPILVFGIIPVFDLLAGLDPTNPPDDVIEELENDKYYRRVVFMYLPIQYLAFFGTFYMIAVGNPLQGVADAVGIRDWVATNISADLVRDFSLSVPEKIGIAVSLGYISGIGINTAHELGHKKESVERWLSKIALAPSFYGHFYIEHNRGHHVRVATPEDPASSRLGESFYRFWPRTVWGSLKSAWRLEKRRILRKKSHAFRLGNDVLNAWLMSTALFAIVIVMFGTETIPYLLLQMVIGFSLLEVVNYLEHYGMLRQKVGVATKRRYERVAPMHSWNSNNIVTNVFLYHLQRHSDHHANPTRRYQSLRDYKESPALPTGYAGMILLALVPPLWRRTMDHRVVAHWDGDVRLANVQPGKEATYLAQFPPPGSEDEHDADDVTVQRFDSEVLAARCPGCDYVYEVEAGDEHEGFAAGTAWKDIPDDWCCPDCGVRDKVDFVPIEPVRMPGR